MMKHWIILFVLVGLGASLSMGANAQPPESAQPESFAVPSKLQIAIEPEEIILTKGITVGADDKNIQLIIRETSGMKRAKLELVARPFTNINSGDIVDVNTVKVGLSAPQVSLEPGGLQRLEVTIGGFEQAGSYLGGMTIHDTVSGERKEIAIRVSVKDSWEIPTMVLLASVLIASGVNLWTRKGRRKNRLDRRISEVQKTMKLAGEQGNLILLEAEQFLEKAQQYNQEFQFESAEAALTGVEQKLTQYEERKQQSEQLRQEIQRLLDETCDLGGRDPQQTRINNDVVQLLPKIQTDYESTHAIFKQLDAFFRAYRLARKDLQTAREKLYSSLDYVKQADKSKIEFILSDIDRLLTTAESMSAVDEANILLRKAAFELSPEKINENIFRSQRLQTVLSDYEARIKRLTGPQITTIATTWYERAAAALADNRYEDVDEMLKQLDNVLEIIDLIKQAEKRVKGRDKRMTELRRIIRQCKGYLEGLSWDALARAEYDMHQVIEMLDGARETYEPFPSRDASAPSQEENPKEMTSETSQPDETEDTTRTDDEGETQLRRLTQDDLRRNFERVMEEAARFSTLHSKIVYWRGYCDKLLEFDELTELFDYLKLIQAQLSLYDRIHRLREQAEEKHLQAVLRLAKQAEQLLTLVDQDELAAYHRAEVLADAAKALLEEKQQDNEFEQVISYIRSPKTASKIVTSGSIVAYFVVATALGFQILYTPNHDFGAILFEDYFSLVLWALGLEGAKMTATNVYEAYFKKEG